MNRPPYSGLALTACAVLLTSIVRAQTPGPALTVNAGADRHPISPFIYGMAYPDAAMAKEIHLPINRWGGDGTTRYNWQIDNTNAGDDCFFMAGGQTTRRRAAARTHSSPARRRWPAWCC